MSSIASTDGELFSWPKTLIFTVVYKSESVAIDTNSKRNNEFRISVYYFILWLTPYDPFSVKNLLCYEDVFKDAS